MVGVGLGLVRLEEAVVAEEGIMVVRPLGVCRFLSMASWDSG
jgi:hypothetical protein